MIHTLDLHFKTDHTIAAFLVEKIGRAHV